jgi:hypothetical protein
MIRPYIKKLIRFTGFDIVRYRPQVRSPSLPPDVGEEDQVIIEAVSPYTMTTTERLLALIHSVRHIARSGITGSIVECGVWRGGSMMAVARTLLIERDTSRHLYLFDTFEGMTEPTAKDKTRHGVLAQTKLAETEKGTGAWCYAGLDEVRTNMITTGYPSDKVSFVKGRVEDTIPSSAPSGPIALLRLDTDWYESTKHELTHLFPRLQPGGILILDDYGHWQGARQAADEFLAIQPKRYYLHRIDYTGRLLLK